MPMITARVRNAVHLFLGIMGHVKSLRKSLARNWRSLDKGKGFSRL
jgi:hypothetical protein